MSLETAGYPSLDEQEMVRLLGIESHHRVLDIGGGDAPFARADVVADAYLADSVHRSGRSIRPGMQYVEASAEQLPFADREFDFAWSRMVFEHVKDPARACAEIQRVAKRGFIETPSPMAELWNTNPTHRWLVTLEAGCGDTETRRRADSGVAASPHRPLAASVLVFRPKPFVRSPFRHGARGLWFGDPQFRHAWEFTHRGLVCTQLYWEDSFDYRVELAGLDDFNYDDPAQAAEAHLDQAINALRCSSVPLDLVHADLREVLRLAPEWALGHNTLGCCLWREERTAEGYAAFRRAWELEPDNPVYRSNATLRAGEQPQLVELRESASRDGGKHAAVLAFDSRTVSAAGVSSPVVHPLATGTLLATPGSYAAAEEAAQEAATGGDLHAALLNGRHIHSLHTIRSVIGRCVDIIRRIYGG